MSRGTPSTGLQLFGNAFDLDCHVSDLLLVLRKTEDIDFPKDKSLPDEQVLLADIHPDLTRKAFIVSLLIALDDQFKVFCQILKNGTDQKLKWNDLKGTALDRFICYSEKVCGLTLPPDEFDRQQLRGLIEVRNCIVHNNSNLDGFGKAKVIESFASRINGLSIEDGYITFALEACEECANLVHKFMDSSYQSAMKKFPD